MDIEGKIYHIKVVDVRVLDYDDYGEEVEIELEILDGPLTSNYVSFRLDDRTKEKYLEGLK